MNLTRSALPLLCLVVGACTPSQPQIAHSFAGTAAGSELEALRARDPALTRAERARLDAAEVKALREQLDFQMLEMESASAYAGLGFVGGSSMGYAITREGEGGVFPNGAAAVELEHIAPRIDRVMPAGAGERFVLGVSPSGTMMSWNPDNMSQQVVLRPQQTTFDQVHALAAQPLSGSDTVAVATQDNMLEIWSLRSGNLVSSAKVDGGQPRVIARGSTAGDIVFGTDDGAVRVWGGRGAGGLLYKHRGPVLDILVDRVGGRIFSAGKDGTVLVKSRRGGAAVVLATFPVAAREVHLDASGKYLAAVPAKGEPLIITLDGTRMIDSDRLRIGPGNALVDAQFLPGSNLLAGRIGASSFGIWPPAVPARGRILQPKTGSGVIDFAVSKRHNLLIIATASGRIEYWDLAKFAWHSTAIIAPDQIDGVAADPAGDRMLVSFVGGKVVGLSIDPAQPEPLRIEADED